MASRQDETGAPPESDALERWRREGGRDDAGDQKDDEDEKDDRKSGGFLHSPWVKIGAIILVVILLIGALAWWLVARNYEDTDDAFIDTHIVYVAPQIAGQVIRLWVNDNQFVRQGQPLLDIDPADARAKLAQVEAQHLAAMTQYNQALASERAAAAQADNARSDLARYLLLQRTAPNAVSRQQIDQARAAAHNLEAQRDGAQAGIANAQAQIAVLDAQIATAQLNLGYTHIVAPVTGHVTQRSVALGNYVALGQQLMAIVPVQVWVTANFKETQLAGMRAGQPVTVTVDACGDADIRGHVQSVQRGAGQAFGILPPENATGNYVKVVQRVPVKILLDKVPKDCILGPGMSVEPSVKVR
jgi:membrane fusion protein (multidrug efflux system)